MWDVEACVRQTPRVMAVVFPHAAGEAFEVGVFHDWCVWLWIAK
jgi:hypothetical protein